MRTAQQLGEIADLLPLLPLMATTHNPLDGEPTRGAPTSRPPMSLHPLALAEEVHAVLGSWVRFAHEEAMADDDDWPADATIAFCMWLQPLSPRLSAHPAGEEWQREVQDVWHRVRRAVGERSPRRPRCTAVHNSQRCNSRVVGINEAGEETSIVEHWRWCLCKACGMTYTFDAALRRLGQLQTLTIPQYAAETGIAERSLRRWVTEQHLTPAGKLGRHPTYERADLDGVSRSLGA